MLEKFDSAITELKKWPRSEQRSEDTDVIIRTVIGKGVLDKSKIGWHKEYGTWRYTAEVYDDDWEEGYKRIIYLMEYHAKQIEDVINKYKDKPVKKVRTFPEIGAAIHPETFNFQGFTARTRLQFEEEDTPKWTEKVFFVE